MEGYARDQLRPQPWIVGEIGIDEPCATSTRWCNALADGNRRGSYQESLAATAGASEMIDLRIVGKLYLTGLRKGSPCAN